MPHLIKIHGQQNTYTFNFPEDRIGNGSMANIYKGKSSDLKRVAIKVIKAEHKNKPIVLKLWQNNINFYLRNRYLMQVYEEIIENDKRHIILEFIEGRSYEKYINDRSLTEEQHLNIISNILKGIKSLHDEGFVHRDIKPSNILIDENLNPKIIDYDLVQRISESQKNNSFFGTLCYSSPEQIQNQALSFSFDLWSVGIILFEVFLNRKPFQCDSKDSLIASINRGINRNQITNKRVFSLLEIALNQNLNKRFHTASEFNLKIKELKDSFSNKPNIIDEVIEFLKGSGFFNKNLRTFIIASLIILIFVLTALIIFYGR